MKHAATIAQHQTATAEPAASQTTPYSEDGFAASNERLQTSYNRPEKLDRSLVRKIDMRLCTISGFLCGLNLLDSNIISSASVTSIFSDLDLNASRYSLAIFIFTLASITFQLPATILMRFVGPPIYFCCTTVGFGLVTLCTAYITTWRQMVAVRVLSGMLIAGHFPGLAYLASAWYVRREQQLRFAFLQSGELIVLATGSIVNFGLNHLDHRHGLRGWQWMYLIQGSFAILIGLVTLVWIPDFPERSQRTVWFLSEKEIQRSLTRIENDRHDAGKPEPFRFGLILKNFLDPKLYAFSLLFFLLNIVSTALAYFLPIILSQGMGFSQNQAILLSAPPYYYAIIPVLISSYIGDRYRVRAPIIICNALILIIGFSMLGFAHNVVARYIGTYLATGAYISNWAAMNAYQANNITGQWKRATMAAAITACNGLGGIAGSYIVRPSEASTGYTTAIWVSIGSHILIILVALALTVVFRMANRRADKKEQVIEEVVGFRYTY